DGRERAMSAGYSGTPLTRKLGIRPGARVAALEPPAHLPELLGELPEDAGLEAEPSIPPDVDGPGAREHDVVLLFCADASTLERRFDEGRRLLAWDGGLWVCWPKLSSPRAADLRQSDVQAVGLAAGLVDNKICAIDSDWSGLRFVHRREDRPG
ncbi:MAG TPA: hypothetical protein VLL48_06165, partial [Longimicrobiales bacterium]|nr:hypothetical protein [Longimicrobiales bacterium]